MSPQEALRLLDQRAAPGENWHLHSRQVGKVALVLGRALVDAGHSVDVERLYVQGLLHDVGRSFNHGPLHGWTGYVYLRSLGAGEAGRGCLAHWLKGRDEAEMAATSRLSPAFVSRVYGELQPAAWSIEDSVLSLADSCVRHTTIVTFDERHAELLQRYGDSRWLRRAGELAQLQAEELAAALRASVHEVLAPLYGDALAAVA
ncbi:MAG: HD domain-containing protein [Planctomycetota bacterium]|nr:MAG: HD domain-containing protein [Planctomycetota bacterium]